MQNWRIKRVVLCKTYDFFCLWFAFNEVRVKVFRSDLLQRMVGILGSALVHALHIPLVALTKFIL